MNLAQFGNQYFDQNQPWKLVKDDKKRCETVLHVCFKIVNALAVFMNPYLPFSSDKIWKNLGNKNTIQENNWDSAFKELKVGTKLEKPQLLFKKLSLQDFMIEEDPFSKADLRVAKILDVKDHPQAEKLYMLHVDLGSLGKRVLVAGMKQFYSKEEIKGKSIVIVANLKPAKIRGIESKGMLLAAEDNTGIVSLLNPGDASPGSEVFIEGIPREPTSILEFDEFKKINMTVGENQEAVYEGKSLMSEKGKVVSDKKVQKGAEIK
jgi:methionyl-tRNA synthetase